MNKIIKIAAALAVLGTVNQANAGPVIIDPDGAGSASAITITFALRLPHPLQSV